MAKLGLLFNSVVASQTNLNIYFYRNLCHSTTATSILSNLPTSHRSKVRNGKGNQFVMPRFMPAKCFISTLCIGNKNNNNNQCQRRFLSGGHHDSGIDQIVDLIRNGSDGNVLVMAGAGLSTPSGIPDFRSPDSGIFDNLQQYKLPYPEAIFDIEYFRGNPKPFNTWSKEFLPGVNYKPSIGHYFVRLLQDKGRLLRHFTQNIDGLEVLAGVKEDKIVAAHGSFSSASCIYCKQPVELEIVKNAILTDETPFCKECGGLVKPDIVFFGEMLPERFWTLRDRDVPLASTLICIGTSLEVYPFAGVADSVPYHTPRLLINRDLVGSFGTREKDCHMSGDLVKNIELLANKLGWSEELRHYCETS